MPPALEHLAALDADHLEGVLALARPEWSKSLVRAADR
jgi:hypothetical protein